MPVRPHDLQVKLTSWDMQGVGMSPCMHCIHLSGRTPCSQVRQGGVKLTARCIRNVNRQG